MAIRLNPRFPVVWRSPDTIQVGVDHPLLVLSGVTTGLEIVLSALQDGIPRSGAIMLGERAGASAAEVSALIEALHPALLADGCCPPPGTIAAASGQIVCIDGAGPTADRVRLLLHDLGLRSLELAAAGLTTSAGVVRPAFAVIIGDYVLDPGRHTRWVRRDTPHLPVIFSDSQVRIGPLVEPGEGACLRCVELDHVDRDPAWPALACQLVSRRSLAESVRISVDVAARVASIVHDRLSMGTSELTSTATSSTSLLIDVGTGTVRRRVHRPHERCGCRSLSGIATVPDLIAVAGPASTSSGTAVSGHE